MNPACIREAVYNVWLWVMVFISCMNGISVVICSLFRFSFCSPHIEIDTMWYTPRVVPQLMNPLILYHINIDEFGELKDIDTL